MPCQIVTSLVPYKFPILFYNASSYPSYSLKQIFEGKEGSMLSPTVQWFPGMFCATPFACAFLFFCVCVCVCVCLTLNLVLLVQHLITDFTFHLLPRLCQPDKIWSCLLLFHLAHPLLKLPFGYVFTSRVFLKGHFFPVPLHVSEIKQKQGKADFRILTHFWPLLFMFYPVHSPQSRAKKNHPVLVTWIWSV